jgi:hypothetical protein
MLAARLPGPLPLLDPAEALASGRSATRIIPPRCPPSSVSICHLLTL